ncbi:type II secretion system F family protein [Aneurinibacillus uraniidurans]|uniref:type II secretion system F family protein n=1 Tax=Aneurinibacillus uraniidurans TaxID=2966586 RepID=UPI00234BF8B6|nr:type II secretion system F family protein [Aneurinibacillus sp. B1]WCN38874.1 type II secretion system F family protein [Aneurinibacillus sp. B1]
MLRCYTSRMRLRIKWSDVLLSRLCDSLSHLLEGGIPLLDALDVTSSHMPLLYRRQLQAVRKELEAGYPLSHALEQIRPPAFFLSLLSAGEAHGDYARCFRFAALHYQKRYEWKQRLRQLLSYPLLLLVLSSCSLLFLLHTILPQMISMYASMNLQLPVFTRLFLQASSVTLSALPIVILLVAGMTPLLLWGRNHASLGLFWLRIPGIRTFCRIAYTQYFARQAGLLFQAGVSILDICTLFYEKAPWAVMRQEMHLLIGELLKGQSLSATMRNRVCFTQGLIRCLELGEQSGQIDECLLVYSEQLERHVRHRIEQMLRWIEPGLLLGIGLIVCGVVFSLFLPVLYMMSRISQ